MLLNILSNILTQANISLALAVGQKFDFYFLIACDTNDTEVQMMTLYWLFSAII